MKKRRLVSLAVLFAMIFSMQMAEPIYSQESEQSEALQSMSGYLTRDASVSAETTDFLEESISAIKVEIKKSGGYAAKEITLEKGREYELSAWVKLAQGATSAEFVIDKNKNGETLNCDFVSVGTLVGNEWTKISGSYTYKGEEKLSAKVYLRFGGGLKEPTYYIHDFNIISGESSAEKSEFDDVERTHWAKDNIEILTKKGIISGVGENLFKPEAKVTRAEFTKMLVVAFGLSAKNFDEPFADVKENDWYQEAVCAAKNAGAIDENMTEGGKFRPNNPITREEAASLAVGVYKTINKAENAKKVSFSDVDEISKWARQYVNDAAALGLVVGTEKGFEPKKNMTRAEASAIILRMMEKQKQTIFYVDAENGDDANDGSYLSPFKTIEKAKSEVRKVNKGMKEDIYVLLKEGRYMLDATLELREEDSGFNGHNVIYKGAVGEKVSISGGKTITGWELHDKEKNIYKANSNGIETRQLFINGRRGIRARSEEGTFTNPEMDKSIGYITPDTNIANWKNITDVEMVFTPKHSWSDRRLGIKSVSVEGDKAIIKIKDLAWDMAVNQSGSGHAPVTLRQYENAYELLDTEGEWYLDKHKKTFYYKPYEGEDMATADVVAPVLEKVVSVFGRSYDTPAHNICFNNITFEHGGWLNPSKIGGHFNNQSNLNVLEKFKSFPGNIIIERANNIDFIECEITKMATTALQFMAGAKDCVIEGCHFYDLSASALHFGDQEYTNRKISNPTAEELIKGFKVNNNYIHDIGLDYYASCGVVLGFIEDAQFCHNELYNLPYSGFHIGYGFGERGPTSLSNITVANNYIHDVMMKLVDGGYIYTNGSTAGVSPIELDFRENYCINKNGGRITIALYNDTGTDNCTWSKNVVNMLGASDGSMFAYGNSSDRTPGCYYIRNYTTHDYMYGGVAYKEKANIDMQHYSDANWPSEAMEIIANAGLEDRYKYLIEIDDSLDIVTTETRLLMDSGKEASVNLKGFTDRGLVYDIEKAQTSYSSSDEAVVSVNEKGEISALKQGKATVTTTVTEGDFSKTRTTEVFVDDRFDKMVMDGMSESLVVGAEIYTNLRGETLFGRPLDIKGTITSDNPEIISVDENGVLRALKQGEANVEVMGEYEGKSLTSTYAINVIDYADQSGLKYPEFSIAGLLHSRANWELMSENGVINETSGGLQFYTPAGYALYTDEMFCDELFTFNLKITNGSWPSISFRQQANLNYGDAGNSLYMLTFSPKTIDLQRFNKGVRTGILYSGAADFVTGGPALPTMVEYDKTYKIQAGAINEENGVRIIVNVDGVNVINFLDSVDGYIKEPGYFGVYCTKGTMDFTR